ncbi:hypothetical protein [Rhodococcus rhodochrous]|uniref:hypothetical protein n=1 Tax=Rhodococcus rhodochrous TaxID=1829 RepID=UPI001CE2931D|nr:hypothetical protein [Rhodococcus rhodochrous]
MIDEMVLYRYRQEFHLSYVEALNEPQAAIEHAMLVWELERDKRRIDNARQESAKAV